MQESITTILIHYTRQMEGAGSNGKVKCSQVCVSPADRQAEETSGSSVISLEEDDPDGLSPALSVNWVGLCGAWTCWCSAIWKRNSIKPTQLWGILVFMAFAHREVCLIPFHVGTFALQTCRCSVPPLSLLSCLANHGIVSNLVKFPFPFMSLNLSF